MKLMTGPPIDILNCFRMVMIIYYIFNSNLGAIW
jgi:hypothetical protein